MYAHYLINSLDKYTGKTFSITLLHNCFGYIDTGSFRLFLPPNVSMKPAYVTRLGNHSLIEWGLGCTPFGFLHCTWSTTFLSNICKVFIHIIFHIDQVFAMLFFQIWLQWSSKLDPQMTIFQQPLQKKTIGNFKWQSRLIKEDIILWIVI